MTAQISDSLQFEGEHFHIADVKGGQLFDPAQEGLRVSSPSTACRCGFYCEYAVLDNALLLTLVSAGFSGKNKELAERGQGPLLFGRPPAREQYETVLYNPGTGSTTKGKRWSDFRYELNQPFPFTGTLIIGADFIEELYVHMGCHPAYKYRCVKELSFEEGMLTGAKDLSREMANYREELKRRELEEAEQRRLKKQRRQERREELIRRVKGFFGLKSS